MQKYAGAEQDTKKWEGRQVYAASNLDILRPNPIILSITLEKIGRAAFLVAFKGSFFSKRFMKIYTFPIFHQFSSKFMTELVIG